MTVSTAIMAEPIMEMPFREQKILWAQGSMYVDMGTPGEYD